MSLKSSPGHNIDLCLLHHQGLLWQCQACLLSDGTSTRLNWVTTLLWRINLQRLCCCLIHLMWMRLTRTSVTPLRKQPKRLSHAGIEITMFHVGMQSVNPSIKSFCSLLRETNRAWQLQLCLPSLTESGGIYGPKQFGALTSHTLVEKRGVFWTILLVGHDTLLITVSFQSMLLHLSWLEMGNTRLLIASHLDLSLKKCLTFGGPQHQTLTFFYRENLLLPSNIWNQVNLQVLIPSAPSHARAALKSWLRDFISSCLRRLKIFKIWRRALVVAIPKPGKPVGGPKELSTNISALCPLQDPREAYLHPWWTISQSTAP